ncbi:MAG: hypothetical protein Q8916_09130 [Bacteroidota bacterium]|nr:hypothetical protein [Bacteroidota bacterium]
MKPARTLFLLAGNLVIHGCTDFQRHSEWEATHDTTANFSTPIFRNVYHNKGFLARIDYNDSNHSFAMFDSISDENGVSFRERFPLFRGSGQPAEPPFQLGDSMVIVTRKKRLFAKDLISRHKGHFEGFYPYGVRLDSDRFYAIVGTDSITDISRGTNISEEDFRKLLETNAVPVRSTLYFASSHSYKDSVHRFSLTNGDFQNAWIIGRGLFSPYKQHQPPTDGANKPSSISFVGGAGFAILSKNYGVDLSLSLIYRFNEFEFRFLHSVGEFGQGTTHYAENIFQSTTTTYNYPIQELGEIAFLYGLTTRGKTAWASVSGGLSYTAGTFRGDHLRDTSIGSHSNYTDNHYYQEIDLSAVGFTIQVKIGSNFSKGIGLGLMGFFTMNSLVTYGGATFSIVFGSLHQ